MIVIPITLVSAIDGRVEVLSTLLIDNIGGTKTRGNYRVRMFVKRKDGKVADFKSKPTREATVMEHARRGKLVNNLVAKALTALDYK